MAEAPEKFAATSHEDRMIPFVSHSSTYSPWNIFMVVPNSTYPLPIRKTGFILFILCSLLTATLAATDCEILNSGISSISSTSCCTQIFGMDGIVCVTGRVTEM
jgi:hypothetical protein